MGACELKPEFNLSVPQFPKLFCLCEIQCPGKSRHQIYLHCEWRFVLCVRNEPNEDSFNDCFNRIPFDPGTKKVSSYGSSTSAFTLTSDNKQAILASFYRLGVNVCIKLY